MKNLQQFSQPNFMFIKTKWVFAIVFSITTVMIGCKKDVMPPGSDETLTQETRTASSKVAFLLSPIRKPSPINAVPPPNKTHAAVF